MLSMLKPGMAVLVRLPPLPIAPTRKAILNNLVQAGALEENAGRSILAAVGDKALAAVPRESRDTVRADIMKQVLILQV